MALLTALFATALLTALGMSVALLGSAETALAANDRHADALAQAARGAAAIAVAELRPMGSWSAVVGAGAVAEVSAAPGAFVDSTLTPPPPWGGIGLDLVAATARLQADTAANTRARLPVPVWRLFEYGPISRLIPAEPRRHPFYLAVWVADCRDVLLVHATAFGAGDGSLSVEVALGRHGDGGSPRVLTFRPNPQ